MPPGRYRRGEARNPLEVMTLNETTQTRISITQSSEPVRKPGRRIAGFGDLFTEQNKASIPRLWERLVPRLPLAGQLGYDTYGVCCAAPEPGSMRYIAGAPIAADAPIPDGLEAIELAPQAYMIFRQVMDGGPVHPQMTAAAREIWGERVPRSGRKLAPVPDLEFYPGDSTPDQPGAWVEWWVPGWRDERSPLPSRGKGSAKLTDVGARAPRCRRLSELTGQRRRVEAEGSAPPHPTPFGGPPSPAEGRRARVTSQHPPPAPRSAARAAPHSAASVAASW